MLAVDARQGLARVKLAALVLAAGCNGSRPASELGTTVERRWTGIFRESTELFIQCQCSPPPRS